MLMTVNLQHVLKRCSINNNGNGIHTVDDWANVLSQGEQQRLAFARILLAKPKVVFLDEASASLDEKNEELLYELLSNNKITYISVGHRPQLAKWHKRILSLDGKGNW